jgi:hypothetical protein
MTTQYVLVDFENVQPRNVGLLRGGPFRIKVFVGASQSKVSFDTAQVLQSFGPDAEYIQITGNGPNALDFHIAYYIGELAAKHPEATFHIISRDTGFDPLIKHLKARGIDCKRSVAITDIPHVKAMASPAAPKPAVKVAASTAKTTQRAKPTAPSTAATAKKVVTKATPAKPTVARAPVTADATTNARYEVVLNHLIKQKSARPNTVKTLSGTIQNFHKPPLPQDQLQAIIALLAARGKIRVDKTKVSYVLG